MGGAAYGGNWSPAAEFNILVDPEAAQVLMNTDVPKTMIGLDVTHRAVFYPQDIQQIKELGHPVPIMAGELLAFYFRFYEKKGMGGCPLHDPLAVASVIDRGVVSTKFLPVQVECHGKYMTGATVVDFSKASYGKPNVEVALEVNREQFVEMVIEALRRYVE